MAGHAVLGGHVRGQEVFIYIRRGSGLAVHLLGTHVIAHQLADSAHRVADAAVVVLAGGGGGLKLMGDEQIGVTIVKRALEEPIRLIASNAGHEGAVVVGKVRDSKQANFGFNAAAEEYTDMIAAGIIDPAKVTRSALQNAASIAALMLTTEAIISEIPDAGKAVAMPGGGEGGMY